MYRADGSEMMSGHWTRGRLQGIGRRIESGGDRYEGEFVDSKAQGLGRDSWTDGRFPLLRFRSRRRATIVGQFLPLALG